MGEVYRATRPERTGIASSKNVRRRNLAVLREVSVYKGPDPMGKMEIPAIRALIRAAKMEIPNKCSEGPTRRGSLNRMPFISRAERRRETLDNYPPSRREEVTTVPKFIDAHPMKPFTADELNKLQKAPPDEFGVTHHDILFSEKDNKIYCVLDASNAEMLSAASGGDQ